MNAPVASRFHAAAMALFVPPVAAALWSITFYAFCWRTHDQLGRWPVSIRDHLDVAAAFPVHDAIVKLGFILVYAPLFWFPMAAAQAYSRAVNWRTFLAALACWSPFVFVLFVDPRGLFRWFID